MVKIISIMAIWDEQNMVALSLQSTKDIVYEYIVVLKPGIDQTKEILEQCKEKWNLNMKIIESDLKLRAARKYAHDLTKEYADYYLIQDGDEVYFTTTELQRLGRKTILDLIAEGYDFACTAMIYLKDELTKTQEFMTWLTPHPFFFKNLPDVFWPEQGDMPWYDPNLGRNVYNQGEQIEPFKFDCVIKNHRRVFLRDVFTQWHDSDFEGSIEDYANLHHPIVQYYREKINPNLTLDEIIELERTRKYLFDDYSPEKYYAYPEVIRAALEKGLTRGIESLNQLELIFE